MFACRERGSVAPLVTTADYKKGQSLINQNDDSAFFYFNKVAISSKDSLQTAMAFSYMAQIQEGRGDYFGSQESLLTSLKFLHEQKPGDAWCLVSDYNQLGRNSSDLKIYDAAIDYYDQALKFANSPVFRAIIFNNKAVAYQRLRRYSEAISIYQSAIDQSKKNKKEYARILSNLAKVRWLQNPAYPAAPELLQALRIRTDEKDEWGQNASYAHLADYYTLSRPDSALLYASKRYAIAQKLGSPDDELEALEKLIPLSSAGAVKQYFSRYQYLSDSLQTARNAAKNQFALIRYEAAQSKADNLKLQQDNTEKEAQILRQRILIWAAVLLFSAAIYVTVTWYQKRQRRTEVEKQNAIRENELKTSQKVHDVVANGLYRLMTSVEHGENIGKKQLLDELDRLYEQSRNLSYEQSKMTAMAFNEVIAGLLSPFSSETIKVLTVGNQPALWEQIKAEVKREIEPVLQELMVNMKKHSGARNVVVKFEREGEYLKIQYSDDGVGLGPNFFLGNGLSSTGNRIAGVGGRIIFYQGTNKGVKISLFLPI